LRDAQVRASNLSDLARVDEFAKRAQRVGDGHRVVGVVQLIEVEVIGAETPQRVLARALHVRRARPEVRVVDRHAELARDDRLITPGAEGDAEHRFGLGGAVDVGGVEEGDPGVQCGEHDVRRARLVEA